MMNIQALDKILGIKPAVAAQQKQAPKAPVAAMSPDQVSVSVPDQYTVRPGDSLASIAYRFRQPISRVLALNPQLTQGDRRNADGTLIFPGDVVTLKGNPAPAPAPAPAPVVKPTLQRVQRQLDAQQVAAAAKVEQERDQALASLWAKQAELRHKRAELADTREQLQDTQDQADAQQAVAQTKFQLATEPRPSSWTSLRQAEYTLDDAAGLLTEVPQDDPDYPTLAGQVQSSHDELTAMQQQVDKLAKNYDGQTKSDIEHLTAAQIAITTGDQKAGLVRNLCHGDSANKQAQAAILNILNDAQRQGQLDETLASLHTYNRKTLGIFPDHHYMTGSLPFVMSDDNLNAYESLISGTSQQDFVSAIADERNRRAEQADGMQ